MNVVQQSLPRQAAAVDELDDAVRVYGSELFGLALVITGNRDDADDALQSAWMDALSHWQQLRDPDKRRQWLARIVARSAVRLARRRSLFRKRTADLESASSLPATMRWDVELAMTLPRLSVRQRSVVALDYGQGYSLDECGDIMQCSGGAARSHLARALVALRKELGND